MIFKIKNKIDFFKKRKTPKIGKDANIPFKNGNFLKLKYSQNHQTGEHEWVLFIVYHSEDYPIIHPGYGDFSINNLYNTIHSYYPEMTCSVNFTDPILKITIS